MVSPAKIAGGRVELAEAGGHKVALDATVSLANALLRCRALQTVLPSVIRSLIEGLLNDVSEDPKQASRRESSDDHHQEFMGEGALHN